MRLEKPLTISEVRDLLNRDPTREPWDYQRTQRWLHALNAEVGGTLLVDARAPRRAVTPNAPPRWTVTLAALKRVRPDLFEDTRNLGAEIDAIKIQLRDLESRLLFVASESGKETRAAQREVARLGRRIQALERRRVAA